MRQVDAPATVATPTADGQASDKGSTGSDLPSSPAHRAVSPDSLSRPARMSMKGIHAAPAAVPTAPAPRADLMDLLSLDDSAAPTEQAKASVSNSDGELKLLLDS